MGERVNTAYTYMLLFLAEKYVRAKNPGKVFPNLEDLFKEFNTKNDFSVLKCELFPFLITIGNGKKNELFTLFGPFTIFKKIGFKTIRTLNYTPELLSYSNTNLLQVVDTSIFKSFKTLNVFHPAFLEGIYDTLKVQNKEDIQNICTSINNIDKYKIPRFMVESLFDIQYWSKENNTYKIFSKFFSENGTIEVGFNKGTPEPIARQFFLK
jgi:hypothetical protein